MIFCDLGFGYEGSLVSVETQIEAGVPSIAIVGMSYERQVSLIECVRNAFDACGIKFPQKSILTTIGVPGSVSVRVDDERFALAVALSILAAANSESDLSASVVVAGRLLDDGSIAPAKGVYQAVANALDKHICNAIVAKESESLHDTINVVRVSNLKEAFDAMRNLKNDKRRGVGFMKFYIQDLDQIKFRECSDSESLDSVKGMFGLKYAMTIAAAGHHNLLAIGNPGCGKSLCLQRFGCLLPELRESEKDSVQRVKSIAGLSKPNERVSARPFRIPHNTASLEGMCGGGIDCHPGEISLAHNGVLFLDEAAEFKSSVLQMLRVPLESKRITLARAGRTTVYPANFQLLMATNPCPCGNYGSTERVCLCSARSIEMYWRKFSEPLLSRMSIRFDCSKNYQFLEQFLEWNDKRLNLAESREFVKKAWETQLRRQGKLNEDLSKSEVDCYWRATEDADKTLSFSSVKYSWLPQDVFSVKKIAMTIADARDDLVREPDVLLAAELRCNFNRFYQ